jgi:hypothetical protein
VAGMTDELTHQGLDAGVGRDHKNGCNVSYHTAVPREWGCPRVGLPLSS